ncbi:N-acetyltransferase family protein [Streptosporangium sp. NPDC003464]
MEQFATPPVGTGLPRMPARVFVCLLTSGSGGLTAGLGAGAREPHVPGCRSMDHDLFMTPPPSVPSIEIRLASVADAALLAELNDSVHSVHALNRPDVFRSGPAPSEVAPIFGSHLAREDIRVFIASSSGCSVGYAMMLLVERSGDALMQPRAFAVLEHLAVASTAIRMGVGTALVDAVRTAAKNAGCSHLLTEVWDFNQEASAFYQAAGFTPMRHHLEQSL